MRRRDFLQGLAASSIILLLPEHLLAQSVLRAGNDVSLRCLGNVNGPRFLDGRTRNATVGLAPDLSKNYSGTKWHVLSGGGGSIVLKCMGSVPGNRWLDGRTAGGTVGLAPSNQKPYTGTRWQVVPLDNNDPNIVALKCLGNIEGPRWLDGRTGNGTVGLAKTTDPPFTGTKWEVRMYPVNID
jgi:hypothetical protein